ncbi:hypothetical protein N7540_008608 [Penicillium herquei]|nr:hypothetical protein N7540_008608 [Penicillium herquei]
MTSRLKKNLCDLDISAGLANCSGLPVEDYIPAELRYACCYWVQHLYHSNLREKSSQIFYFLHRHFLHWFEALALLSKPRSSKIYTSTITVRQEKSKVQRLFKDQVPKWICLSTNARDEWSSLLYELGGHSDAILDVAFCYDGRRIVSSSRDCSIQIWNADTGEVMKSFYFGSEGHWLRAGPSFDKMPFGCGKMMLALSADGTKLASLMRGIVQLDIVVCQIEQEFEFSGDRLALSPDGSQTASTGKSKLVLIWESSTGHVQQILDSNSPRAQISNKVYHYDPDWRTCLLQWASAGLVQILGSHISVAVSSDGSKLAVAGCRFSNSFYSINGEHGQSTGLILLWNPNTGQLKHAFNFDTTQILDDSTEDFGFPYAIQIWDISTGQTQQVFHYNYSLYPALAFSPDCNSLAIAFGSNI